MAKSLIRCARHRIRQDHSRDWKSLNPAPLRKSGAATLGRSVRLAPVLAAIARIGPGRRLRWGRRLGLWRCYRPLPCLDLGALLRLRHLPLLELRLSLSLSLSLGTLLGLNLATGALLSLCGLALRRLGGLLLPPRLSALCLQSLTLPRLLLTLPSLFLSLLPVSLSALLGLGPLAGLGLSPLLAGGAIGLLPGTGLRIPGGRPLARLRLLLLA